MIIDFKLIVSLICIVNYSNAIKINEKFNKTDHVDITLIV